MADDSQTPSPPNINLYNVASDDALWVLETDHEQLLEVLAHPSQWVRDNVKVTGEPATLWEPFVVVFHEVSSTGRKSTVHADGTEKPIIHVKGIHETAMLSVRYSRADQPAPPPEPFFPPGETLAILRVGNVVHTHLELRGFTSRQVASSIFNTVTTPEAHIAAMNELPQTLNGEPTPDDQKLKFVLHPTIPPHVVYQGWRPKPEVAHAMAKASDEEKSTDCAMSNGDANAQGQVIVDGVIIKTYTLPP
jgi:hypothetical protein